MHIPTLERTLKRFCTLSLHVKRYEQPEAILNHLITSNLFPCLSFTESPLRSGAFGCDFGLLVLYFLVLVWFVLDLAVLFFEMTYFIKGL